MDTGATPLLPATVPVATLPVTSAPEASVSDPTALWHADVLRYLSLRARGKVSADALARIGRDRAWLRAICYADPTFARADADIGSLGARLGAVAKRFISINALAAAERQLELMASPRDDVAARMVDSALDRTQETARVTQRPAGDALSVSIGELTVILQQAIIQQQAPAPAPPDDTAPA